VADVRQPRLDEVGAERQDRLGVFERVVRDRVAVKRDLVRGPDRLVCEGLQCHARARAEGLAPPIEESADAARLELRYHRDRAALATVSQCGELLDDELLGHLPRCRLEAPAALPDHRAGYPVRVVETL